jgi:uncharacterized protein (DUF3084 family)
VQLRRNDEHRPPEDERALLREQREALEGLRRQLAERVAAVEARERELRSAIADARAGNLAPDAHARAAPGTDDALRARLTDVERRERAVAERERALAATDDSTAETPGDGSVAAALAAREQALAAREDELDRREERLLGRENETSPGVVLPEAPSDQLEEIEARLAELREAESLFLRTRQELADRSEAVAARERLVAQRERELDGRDDAAWGRPEVAELEARLRRLEQHERRAPSVEDTQGFSGGFRRLQEEGTRRAPGGGTGH